MHDISLVQAFLSPDRMSELGIDELLLGATGTAHQAIDVDVVNALRNQLVGRPLDLAALNIFRGRDTGIAPFNSVREQLHEKTGLASLRSYSGWEDFQKRNGLTDDFINQLKEVYPEGFEAMDLWVGGLAEKPTKGQLGSTFGYLFLEQLDRLQDGDRFYYLEILDDSMFEDSGQTFADIVMRNTGITGPSDVFKVSSGGQTNGSRVPCEEPVYHAPTDISLSNRSVKENSAVGTIIGVLSAVDADAGDTFTYTLSGPAAGLFKISGDKLVVAERANLDYETAKSHDITIKVTDNTGRSYSEAVTINTQDVTEPKPEVPKPPQPPKDLLVKGTRGDDNLYGGDGNDRLYGDKGNDTLDGKAGHDRLYGGDGNDLLRGGAGADRMWGDKGKDTYEVDNHKDDTVESRDHGTDAVKASVSYSLGKNVENLTLTGSGNLNAAGNEIDNTLIGNSGSNILKGGGGQDVLKGGDGNDVLMGGKVKDEMTGGAGKDTFVFERSGHDTITDFRDGEDRIDASRLSGVDQLSDLAIWQAGNDTVIWYKFDLIVLKGVNASDLGNSDFVF
nr:peroxidase family protein [Microvirga soli]